MQDPTYKKRSLMVRTANLGPKARLNNPDGFHPMQRLSWGAADALRAAAGHYYTVYQSAKGAALVNYASITTLLAHGESPGNWDHAGGSFGPRLNPPRVRLQLQHSILQIPGFGWAPARENRYSPIFTVKGNEAAWNNFQNKEPQSAGIWSNTKYDGRLTGEDSYFIQFAFGGNDIAGTAVSRVRTSATTTYDGIVSLSSSMQAGNMIHDYVTEVYSLSSDHAVRAASGMMIEAKSEYNYYADTTPNYEQATSRPLIPEGSLPNAYIMYSELQNTGSVLLAPFHMPALDIPRSGPGYFLEPSQTQTGVTERNTVGAYQLWAQGLDALSTESMVESALGAGMLPNNTNFAILHSDEAITNSEYIANEMLSYCVGIVIPDDHNMTTGIKAPASLLRDLANNKDTKHFIDVLQTAAINRMLQLGPRLADAVDLYTVTTRDPLSSTDASDYRFVTTTGSVSVLCDVNAALREYMAGLEVPGVTLPEDTQLGYAIKAINDYRQPPNAEPPNSILATLPYRFLKDYGRSAYNPDRPLTVDSAQVANAAIELSSSLQEWSRTYPEILAGTPCHSETLMYVVSKYALNDDGSQPANPVQTFYISNKLDYKNLGNSENVPITFYDSQVKYETKYRYVFHKMVAVIGNDYYYERPGQLPLQQNEASNFEVGLRVRNRPNIRVLLVPMIEDGLETMVVDRPPVPPEMSFYLHKGVNNKLRILLNGNVGRYDQVPIEILDSDPAFFEKEYLAQTGEELPYTTIKKDKKKIRFSSDDPVDAYQLFRLESPPENYKSFVNSLVSAPELDPTYGTPSSYVDTVVPNRIYYYCARSVDVHGNYSNPTTIIEVEVIDNEGKIYLKQKPYTFKSAKQRLIKSARRFIMIEPALQQAMYDQGDSPSNAAPKATPTHHLGQSRLQDSLWNKRFKIRICSKQTGRKIDLNIRFKNSGTAKES